MVPILLQVFLSSAHDSTDFVLKAISFIKYTCEKDLDIF